MTSHALASYLTPAPSPPNGAVVSTTPQPHLTVLASNRAVVAGRFTPATIVISPGTGKIVSVFDSVIPASTFPAGTSYTDYSPHILLPGLVDAHVHLNEPGRTEWEGFWTGTRAAAFGGVTTVIDMPLNAIPPTTTVAGLKEKVAAAKGKCWVDVGFYGGIIPGNIKQLKPLVDMGVKGFKGFLIDSGVPEFPAVSSTDIALAMTELADQPTTLMFHAEMPPPITASVRDDVPVSASPLCPTGPVTAYQTFLDSRPSSFETYAIEEIISLAHLAPHLPLHIVHLSAIEAIPILREARQRGVNITAETCFHYLSLAAENISEGDTRHKCCPPIRSSANQDGLWDELRRKSAEGYEHDDSVIRTVVSDHSPCTPSLKLLPRHLADPDEPTKEKTQTCNGQPDDDSDKGDFFAAWGGISSVGLGLPILYTEGLTRYTDCKALLTDIVTWCCHNTALQVGLETKKGELAVGFDADVVVFDPEGACVVERSGMLFRNKCSPYEGRRLRGVVRETWVRGMRVWCRDGEMGGFGKEGPRGRVLLERRRR